MRVHAHTLWRKRTIRFKKNSIEIINNMAAQSYRCKISTDGVLISSNHPFIWNLVSLTPEDSECTVRMLLWVSIYYSQRGTFWFSANQKIGPIKSNTSSAQWLQTMDCLIQKIVNLKKQLHVHIVYCKFSPSYFFVT